MTARKQIPAENRLYFQFWALADSFNTDWVVIMTMGRDTGHDSCFNRVWCVGAGCEFFNLFGRVVFLYPFVIGVLFQQLVIALLARLILLYKPSR